MANKKICIVTDCACDLPSALLAKYDITVVYFYIETDTGLFRDVDEITSQNIFEYHLRGGKKSETTAPPPEEFAEIFKSKLKEYNEVIHIAISSKVSKCVNNATAALELLGEDKKRVHIFDSYHLSTGMGHLILRAAQMLKMGCSSAEVISELEIMKKRISTTFMVDKVDYLYRNGRIGKWLKDLCDAFNIHPVLEMKNGYIKIKSVKIGSFERSALKYVRAQLKNPESIKSQRIFIAHAGCSVSDIKMIRQEIERVKTFDSIITTKASATISGNSGPRTFGVIFERGKRVKRKDKNSKL